MLGRGTVLGSIEMTAGALAALNAADFFAASAFAASSAEEAVPMWAGESSSSLPQAPLDPGWPSRTGTPDETTKPSPPAFDEDCCLLTLPVLEVKTDEEDLRLTNR
jgi:hypothetical protein